MELKDLIDWIGFDVLLEGIGAVFSIGLLIEIFFEGGILRLIEIYVRTMCG